MPLGPQAAKLRVFADFDLPRPMRPIRIALPLLVLLPGLFAPVEAGEQPALNYQVSVQGAGELEAFLLAVADSEQLRERAPPPGLASLRRRARSDLQALDRALRSRGYYAAQVDFELDSEVEPIRLRFRVDPGPLYRFADFSILEEPADTEYRPPAPNALGLVVGAPALAAQVLAAEKALLKNAREASFALAELGKRHVVVDHSDQSMDVELHIAPGPQVTLGPAEFSGGEGVDRSFVQARIPWEPGTVYHPELLAKARRELVDTNLFASVRLQPGKALDEAGQLPVHIDLAEREHRTAKLSLTYDTDLGPGVRVGWWHRNLFGAGQRLSLEAGWTGVGPELTAHYRQPDFFRLDQALIGEFTFKNEDTDAFNSKSAYIAGGVERNLSPGMDITVALGFRYSRVEPADGLVTENYGFLSLPVLYNWDFSDDLLDPSRGGRLSLLASPQADLFGSGVYFGKFLGRYSHYLQLREQPRLVLAGRIALGSIIGAQRDDVPADERFYAGGGGSIRGYGYQLASPLDAEDHPIGGDSLLELSLEFRWNFTDTLGVVGFVDAGGAFEKSYPQPGEDLFYAAGGGLRYYSPMGPLRVDVGVPLNRRDGVDDPYQLYISIGQAF